MRSILRGITLLWKIRVYSATMRTPRSRRSSAPTLARPSHSLDLKGKSRLFVFRRAFLDAEDLGGEACTFVARFVKV
jgi:hypothetical protein